MSYHLVYALQKYRYHAYDDLYDFGLKIGLLPQRVTRFLNNLLDGEEKVKSLVSRSFLSEELKDLYLKLYFDKLKRLRSSLSGKI